MLYLGTTPLAGNIKTKLFTSSGTFVVPADVYCIWIDGCGGGGGGGGGDPTPGGGGGGGGPAVGCFELLFPVTPGEILTVIVGAAGAGGEAGAAGAYGGASQLVGSACAWKGAGGDAGMKGLSPNGGDGGGNSIASVSGGAGGAGAGGNGSVYGQGAGNFSSGSLDKSQCRISTASGGGALNYNSGYTYRVDMEAGAHGETSPAPLVATGGSSGGGGGRGGGTRYGINGIGGSNGAAGGHATGYGAGGGGGSGNAPGGNGSPGFLLIYYISKYTIA